MARVVIVGAGILGTMHAVLSRRAGWHVTQIDADVEPRSASVKSSKLSRNEHASVVQPGVSSCG